MNSSTKVTSLLQSYRLVIYKRALHPELFKVRNRLTISHGMYEFEGWVMPGGHVLRFQHNDECVSELVTAQDSGLPERGVVGAYPCAGEHDYEQSFGDSLKYVATVQTETLSDNLYTATYNELIAFAREVDAATHTWIDPDAGKCASILDVQRFKREIHAQAYHLCAAGGLVLRSQTIFEHT